MAIDFMFEAFQSMIIKTFQVLCSDQEEWP